MKIGGLASGMDVDEMVEKLMAAERKPMEKMEQDKTDLEWKRDGFRDINKSLLDIDNKMPKMKEGSTYNSKSVTSSNESAVTGTASSDTDNGSYSFKVDELAKSAINISKDEDGDAVKLGIDPNEEVDEAYQDTFKFYTFDDDGESDDHEFSVDEGDSLNDVLKKINDDDDNNVRAFYDENQDRVIMETTRDGEYNPDGAEIEFDESNTFFTDVLKLYPSNEEGGTDAEFEYNGETMTSKSNSYEINGMEVEFKEEGQSATLQVENDTEDTVESIMSFVEDYNDVVEKMNETQKEEKDHEYPPLTDEQKEEMSEDEIEKWEEKAKSGILRGESSISSGLADMRQSWYDNVETGGEIESLTQIGITTSKNYLDGGKLEVDEEKLTEAVQENPEDVEQLFTSTGEGDERGLIHRLEGSLESTMKEIESTAGGKDSTLETYTIGREMKQVDSRIDDFEDRLERVEDRYWDQFTEMEKAIQQMNSQSEQMMNQLGGGGMGDMGGMM